MRWIILVTMIPVVLGTGCNQSVEETDIYLLNRLPKSSAPPQARWCHGCHGINGRPTAHPMVPNLAGQRFDYLLTQLKLFRNGAAAKNAAGDERQIRDNRSMRWHVNKLRPADLAPLAAFYADQACPTDKTRVTPLADNRCTACHGNRGISHRVSVPNLAGQNAGYMLGQLEKFKESASGRRISLRRPWRSHPVMSDTAGSLDAAEVASVYAYAAMRCR